MVNIGVKQLWRNIRSSFGQFLSIMLVVAVGAFLFAGMNEASRTLKRNVDDYYDETALAAVTGVFGVAGDIAVEEAIRTVNEREHRTDAVAEGRYVINTTLTYEDGRFDTVLMTATDRVNKPRMTAGRPAAGKGECIVDETFARANGLAVGDEIEIFNPQVKTLYLETDSLDPGQLKIDNYTVAYTEPGDENARTIKAKVTGFFTSPEYLYKVNQADISAAKDEFALVIVPYEDVRTTTDIVTVYATGAAQPFIVEVPEENLYNQVLVPDTRLSPDEVFAAYDTPFVDEETGDVAVYVSKMSYTRADGASEKSFRSAYRQISSLVAIIPTLFFVVAAVITFISLSKMVDNERAQIAVMQAIGRKKSAIYFMYTAYALLAAILGTLLGGIAGMFTLPQLYNYVFNMQFIMPPFVPALSGGYIVLAAVIACAVSAAAAGVSIYKTLRLTPAAAMRPKVEKIGHATLIERWAGLWKRLGFGSKMILRNIFRNKLRILLSSIGVIGSVMLMIMGIGMYDRVHYAVDSYDDGLRYEFQLLADNPVSIDAPVIEGVDQELTAAPMYAVTVAHGNKTSELVQLTSLPAGSEAIRLTDKKGHGLPIADDSLILPHFLADDLGLKAGDAVTLSGVYGQYECVVTGVSVQYLMPTVYCGRDVYAGLKAPAYTDNLYMVDGGGLTDAQLEALPGVKIVRSRADMAARALDTAVILNIFVAIIVIGAAVLALTVIYNITAINVHEREREIATLMVLGYKRGETSRLIIIENVVTTIIGCLLGLPLGYGLLRWTGRVASSLNVSLPLNLTAPVVLVCFGLAFVFSMVATTLLLKKVFKIDMVGALKSAE